MDPLVMIMVVAVVAMLPIILFLGLVTTALFLWCAKRIWPIPRDIGKWAAKWRNFAPLSGLVFVLFLLAFIPSVLISNIMAGLVLLVFGFLVSLAAIVWIVRYSRVFWRLYIHAFWRLFGVFPWIWGMLWKKIPDRVERRFERREGPPPARRRVREPEPDEYLEEDEEGLSEPSIMARGREFAERRRQTAAIAWLRFRRGLSRVFAWFKGLGNSSAGFARRNFILLMLPFIFVLAVIALVLAVPFIPLFTVVAVPVLIVTRLRRADSNGADEGTVHGREESSLPGMSLISRLVKPIESLINRVLKLMRLK